MKKFITFALALCLAFSATLVVFATTPTEEEIDFMNYDFPEDSIILYQGEDGVIYQSKEMSNVNLSYVNPLEMTYESVWIDKNKYTNGVFDVKNPHPWIWSTTNGTIKVQSEDPNVAVKLVVSAGVSIVFNKTIKPADGDVHIEFSNIANSISINYFVDKASREHGMRIMCWLW